jgi:isoquinoline 1-oxidoreductase subunit beta
MESDMTYIAKTPGAFENVSRRGLLKGVVASGSFVFATRMMQGTARAYETGAAAMHGGVVSDPRVFIAIDQSGIVSIVTHRSEMGTGIRTSLPMIVADELEADWDKVRIVQAPGDEIKYGNQDTDGSRSTRHFIQPMRACGATMRLMLEMAAAAQWKVPLDKVEAKNNQVVNKDSGQKLGYGELAAAASALPTPAIDKVKLKDPKDFRYIGKGDVRITDLYDITVGKARYGQDVVMPGMKYAVVARPPVVGGKVTRFDASAALKVPGVLKVVEIDPPPAGPPLYHPVGGVAVIAENTWAAIKGREALNIDWNDGPNGTFDSATHYATLAAASKEPGKIYRNGGDVEAGLKSAAKVITADYYVPHLPHATMEPPAATASYANGKCEVWAPTQSPQAAHDFVVKRLGLKDEDVKVNVTLVGGGFGRKSKCDFVVEAAVLSKAMGAPVKVVWTRDDDLQHDYYHASGYERLDAGLDADNKVVAWRHRAHSESFMTTFADGVDRMDLFPLGFGASDTPFNVPNLRIESGKAEAHTRIGWFRSVYNVQHAFAIQSFVAELANAAGKDPKDYLLELIGADRIVDVASQTTDKFWNYGEPTSEFPIDTARLRNVIEVAAKEANWGRTLPPGHGLGIAGHRSFVSYVATVVEVAVDSKGKITIPRVDTAIDCGFAVNPERIRAQCEGAAVMGTSLALFGEVTFKNGRVQQATLDDFKLARATDAPLETYVHIIKHGLDVHPTGVGEPGIAPFAPALANAIFAATGKRIRRLPIGDQLKA